MAYRIDIWRDVVIGVWRATPTASCLGDMDAALSAVAGQWPSVALLNIAEHTVEMPSSELRKGMLALIRSRTGLIRCTALVVEGGGFKSAAIRAAVVSMELVIRNPAPNKAFQSVYEAARWMAPRLCPVALQTPSPTEMIAAVERIRASRYENAR